MVAVDLHINNFLLIHRFVISKYIICRAMDGIPLLLLTCLILTERIVDAAGEFDFDS